MTVGLIFAFLFFVGSLVGWCLEFGYRNLVSHNGPKLGFFINPGFCRGPYLPIYGVGVCVMFAISYVLTPEKGDAPVWAIILGIGVCMSLIELIGGWILLKFLNMRLWDYSKFPGNFKGYICPQFSLVWMVLGGAYYMLIQPIMVKGLYWLAENLAFSFMIGLFFGFFIVDLWLSNQDAMIVKEFGKDNETIIRYDELKAMIQRRNLETIQKTKFFNQLSFYESNLSEMLKDFDVDNLLGEGRLFVDSMKKKVEEIENEVGSRAEKISSAVENKAEKISQAVESSAGKISSAVGNSAEKISQAAGALKESDDGDRKDAE